MVTERFNTGKEINYIEIFNEFKIKINTAKAA